MTARFMIEGSKRRESKQKTRGHRPRLQVSGCASLRLWRKRRVMLKKMIGASTFAIVAATLAFGQTPCDRLKSMALPAASITAAESIPAGPYLPIGLPPAAAANAKIQVPAYCRVAAVLTPSSDSHIE